MTGPLHGHVARNRDVRPAGSVDPNDPDLAQHIADDLVMFELVDDAPDDGRDAIVDWAQIFSAGHLSPRNWAFIASAIHSADNHLTHTADMADAVRGDERWCRLAADTYHVLRINGAYAHIPPAEPERCLAERSTIETWLDAPAPGRPYASTVADVLGLVGDFTREPHVSTAAVDRVLSDAQDAGVFGVPDHRVELHHLFPSTVSPAGLVLVTRPIYGYLFDHGDDPDAPPRAPTYFDLGPGRPSGRVEISDLLPGQVAGVDAAVMLLTRAAELVNAPLHPHSRDVATKAERVAGHSVQDATSAGSEGRAMPFVPLRLDPTPSNAAAAPNPAIQPRPSRQR